jgi:dTDP-4-dehydrorhamnose reductase
MKIACTGIEPGRIAKVLMSRGVEFVSADVTDSTEFRKAVKACNPDLIIHTAAMTDIDACETAPLVAKKVNVDGINNLIEWYTGKIIFLSSDHVFPGTKWFNGYSEKHKPNPVNVYGMTKIAGEFIAVNGLSDTRIIRTSKVFSAADLASTLSVLSDGEKVVFTDLIRRSFLFVNHFVDGLMYAVSIFDRLPEIVNLSGTDIYSYAEFWWLVCNAFGIDSSLIESRKTELPDLSPRPFRGGLNTHLAKQLGFPLYSAVDGIEEMRRQYDWYYKP